MRQDKKNSRKKNVLITISVLLILVGAYTLTHLYTGRDFVYINPNDSGSNKVAIGENPVVSVSNTLEVKINQKFKPEANLSVRDKEDGIIKNEQVKIHSNVNTKKAGVYTVSYEVADSDKNKVKSIQIVIVNDGSLAIGDSYIIQAQAINANLDNTPKTKEAIIKASKLKIYNKFTGSEISPDKVKITNNTIKHKVGEYNLTFTYKDDVSKDIKITISE